MQFTCYKMSLPDGYFYIGSTTKNLENYNGSGSEWKKHKKRKGFTDQDIIKEIISQNFENEEEMRSFEKQEIAENINDPLCLNQCVQTCCNKKNAEEHICSECGGKGGNHRKGCPKAVICQECGVIGGNHKESCSQYKVKPCPECGGIRGHFDSCSKSKGKCQYCGYSLKSNRHARDCPLYKEPQKCQECGGIDGKHKKSCSRAVICPECGGSQGLHKKGCSKAIICNECGAVCGRHKKDCSKYKSPKPCSECGKIYGHKKSCSHYASPKPCPECGGERGNHFKICSKYKQPKICFECGGKGGHHKKSCSKYKPLVKNI